MEKEEIVLEVMVEDKGKRLDSFVSENIEEITRSYLQTLIDDGNVSIEGKTKIKAGQKLKGNEIINDTIMTAKATFRFVLKNTKEIIKAAIPIATFKP